MFLLEFLQCLSFYCLIQVIPHSCTEDEQDHIEGSLGLGLGLALGL